MQGLRPHAISSTFLAMPLSPFAIDFDHWSCHIETKC